METVSHRTGNGPPGKRRKKKWQENKPDRVPGRRSVPASVMWVPAAAGLLLAGEVVMDLTAGLREGEPS